MIKIIIIFLLLPAMLHGQEFLSGSVNDFNFKKFYNFIKDSAPSENAFVAVQRLAEPHIRQGNWEAAGDIFMLYKPDFPGMEKRFDKILGLINAIPRGLAEKNLGPNVNTAGYEHTPMPTADGTLMYFTGIERDFMNRSEDVFVCERIADEWTNARKLEASLNTMHNEAPQCISTDGNLLILFGNYPEQIGRGDLYYSEKTDSGWTYPKLYPRPINSEYFDCDAKITADGKTLIFVSERPGGVGETHLIHEPFHGTRYGNSDIYISFRTDTGWSEPINLGPTINTPYAERKPFLHPDGRTLYFASDGHYGLGRLDLFVSRRLREDSWTEWSEPVNLGKEINGSGTDWGAVVSTEGSLAYFAATDRKVNYGGTDIYTIELPEFARPNTVVTIQGTVRDCDSDWLAADIVWEDLATGERVGRLKSDPQNGHYVIVLPVGRKYGYYAEKEGYYPISKNIDLQQADSHRVVTENITLFKIDNLEKEAVRINNVFFEFDKSRLLPESIPELERLLAMLEKHPQLKIEIAGHTDDVGTDVYNNALSQRRAKAVSNYLTDRGIDRSRITTKGYGSSQPMASNENETGRASNRRVEFRVLKNNSK
ncbi:MAG: OmpA family protein [Candidatus Kapaibacterium sp.]